MFKGGNRKTGKRTLVVGTGSLVGELLDVIRQQPRCGYQVEGVVTETPQEGGHYHGFPVLGAMASLTGILQQRKLETIIVAHTRGSTEQYEHQLLDVSLGGEAQLEPATAVFERLTGKLPLEAYEMEDVLYSDTFRPGRISLAATRLLSLVIALFGLIICAPVIALIAVLIKLDSTGPVLFQQERAGFRGKCFMLKKFRTMVPDDGHRSEWESDNAHRITRIGRWLRKFRLDELPQFFNILRGDMNLVGPRPHPASNIAMLALVARNTAESGVPIPYYTLRSCVRPGITGWAQVRYRYANNLQEEMEKLHFDLYYLKHFSFFLDLRILFETVWVVVAGYMVKAQPAADADRAQPDRASSRGQAARP